MRPAPFYALRGSILLYARGKKKGEIMKERRDILFFLKIRDREKIIKEKAKRHKVRLQQREVTKVRIMSVRQNIDKRYLD